MLHDGQMDRVGPGMPVTFLHTHVDPGGHRLDAGVSDPSQS